MYLGNWASAKSPEVMEHLQITHVINATAVCGMPFQKEGKIKYARPPPPPPLGSSIAARQPVRCAWVWGWGCVWADACDCASDVTVLGVSTMFCVCFFVWSAMPCDLVLIEPTPTTPQVHPVRARRRPWG